jgi:predicted DNA-binding ribbon-helix-helix protein
MKKRRVNYNLTDRQHKILQIIAGKQELSVSELLRRILDEWLDVNAKDLQISSISDTESDKRS